MTKSSKSFLQTASALLVLAILTGPFQNCAQIHNSEANQSLASQEAANVAYYQDLAMQVLSSKCLSCHNPTAPPNSGPSNILDVDSLILGNFIIPGQPQNSPVYLNVVDGVMPKGGPVLSSYDFGVLSNWIWVLGNPSLSPVIIGSIDPVVTPPSSLPTYTRVRNEIILPRCLGCHGPATGRYLGDYNGVKAFVVVGNPVTSVIYQEVNTNNMPKPPNAPLTAAQKLLIFNWIMAGALNN